MAGRDPRKVVFRCMQESSVGPKRAQATSYLGLMSFICMQVTAARGIRLINSYLALVSFICMQAFMYRPSYAHRIIYKISTFICSLNKMALYKQAGIAKKLVYSGYNKNFRNFRIFNRENSYILI
jgi:hypothetical protein